MPLSNMQHKFLLLMGMCVLATALPLDKRSVESSSSESESHESREVKSSTTAKPLPSKIIAIKDAADLETRISQAGDKVVIIFFMTTWCPFSKDVTPTIEDIAAKTENLIVLKVDRDKVKEDKTVWKYGLSGMPSVPRFFFIKEGKLVKEISGSEADIRGTLSNVISTNESNSSDSSDE